MQILKMRKWGDLKVSGTIVILKLKNEFRSDENSDKKCAKL
jgi:hypothetical protein